MDIFPIGTVVTLQSDSHVKFMIVGYFPTNQEGERRDYAAVRYPMGVYDSRMYFFFNATDVAEVLHTGYVDDEFVIMTELINNESSLKEGAENGKTQN